MLLHGLQIGVIDDVPYPVFPSGWRAGLLLGWTGLSDTFGDWHIGKRHVGPQNGRNRAFWLDDWRLRHTMISWAQEFDPVTEARICQESVEILPSLARLDGGGRVCSCLPLDENILAVSAEESGMPGESIDLPERSPRRNTHRPGLSIDRM